MVKVQDLIKIFQQMYEEHWRYEHAHHEKGCVDCSGAFTYSMKQFGIDYPNGSNAIARNYIVGGMKPISEAKPGMAAFKAKEPTESGYSLPEKYKQGGRSYTGDIRDYYHIGLVDEDTKYVLNAKGTNYGFCRDKLTSSNGWDFVAYLKSVDYDNQEKGETTMAEAKVVLPSGASGATVNMRKSAMTDAALIIRVPVGSTVTVLEDLGQWCKITYSGKTGYMMSNYLEYAGQPDESNPSKTELTEDQIRQIDEALKEIEKQIDVIGSITGRG